MSKLMYGQINCLDCGEDVWNHDTFVVEWRRWKHD